MKENSIEEIAEVDEDRAIREIKRELADEDRKEYMSRWFAKDLEILVYYIEKLQKENEELKNQEATQRKINELLVQRYSNSIPIQKVKDAIEKEIKYHEKNILDIENITMLKGKTVKEAAEIEFNKYAIVVLTKMLQELLEWRK